MKTIEEKAKAYDEALERGKQILNTPYTAHWDIMKDVTEHLLPELKESEDERIRTFLHHTFTAQYLCKDKLGKWHGEPVVNILAYLEKQGEQKHQYKSRPRYVGETELLGEQKTHWRPSEEQMEALKDVIENHVYDCRLEELLEQLKKLRE